MILELYQEQERIKARKQYNENIDKISDLDDICNIVDDVKYRMGNTDYEFKIRHMKELSSVQDEIIDEIKFLEDENLELEEIWDESEEW